ncbi:MAG TPA: NUDIX hydrolase [Gammaproteobacteria bacterium]
MRFCSQCGAPVVLRIPEGDNLPRHVCDSCSTIHYDNPRIVAGCVVTREEKILICRRAIEPRKGFWTLPAGFMEHGETIAEAAAREAMEEACADVELDALYAIVDVIHVGQVHMMYRGRLKGGYHEAGPESIETALVSVTDIPWSELAFPSVRFTLERFREDLAAGGFGLHSHKFDRRT